MKKTVIAFMLSTITAASFMQAPAIHAGEMVASREIMMERAAGAGEVMGRIDLTEAEVQAIVERNNMWKNPGSLVMAHVNSSVNVRMDPNEEAELAGKLYKDCGGTILEYTDSWTKIQSGDVVGWVRNDYLLFGNLADELAQEVGFYRATVTAEGLRVRKEASTDAGVYGMVEKGDQFEVVADENGWVSIDYEGATGYISAEFLDVAFHVDYGETIEAIKEREAREEAAKLAAAKKANAKKQSVSNKTAVKEQKYGAYAASATDRDLLGALIYCEAGNQPYEGKVAVGAVVMNRLRSPHYPSTLYGVIYASGQFSPAASGAVDRAIAKGVPASCLQAADEALSGVTNVGSACSFRHVGKHDGIEIGAHVFW